MILVIASGYYEHYTNRINNASFRSYFNESKNVLHTTVSLVDPVLKGLIH